MKRKKLSTHERIGELDRKLKPIFATLTGLAKDLRFDLICELSLSKLPLIEEQNYKGLYLIEVDTKGAPKDLDRWVAQFRDDWDLPKYKRQFTCTTKDKRIERHGSLLRWMPLYIGRSRKVGARVKEHLTLPMKARTFALKIQERPNMRRHKFRLRTIRLDVVHYNLLAPTLEEALRDLINPIVGKQ